MSYYNFQFDSVPKEWNNKCPDCGSLIKWGLHSGTPGANTAVYCSKSLFASREITLPLKDMRHCTWLGRVVRQQDGGVRFRDGHGRWLKEVPRKK
jgi:hypothetical protein